MKFCLKGVTFTEEELEKIKISELRAGSISRQHLFIFFPSTKKIFFLLRAGSFLDQEFIDKYIKKGFTELYSINVAKESNILEIKEYFKHLKLARIEIDRINASHKITKYLSEKYFKKTNNSFLELVIACREEFNHLPESIIAEFYSKCTILYSRSLAVSTISVLTSLASNYYDYNFIKDIYNTTSVLDYGLLEFDGLGFHVLEACNMERTQQASGLNYLASISFDDYKKFKDHPIRSAELCEEYISNFYYQEMIHPIELHHEKSDGEGFPNGYFRNVLSEAETVMMFSDHFFPFEEIIYGHNSADNILMQNYGQVEKFKKDLSLTRHGHEWERSYLFDEEARVEA